jgi:hypothetical protein
MEISKATELLARYTSDPKQDPVILTVKGTPVAVVLPTNGADYETISLSLNPKFLAIIERSRMRHAREGGISPEEIRKKFGIPPYEGPRSKSKSSKKATSRKRNGKKK